MSRFDRRSGYVGGVLMAAVLWLPQMAGADLGACPKETLERLPIHVRQVPRFEADATYVAEADQRYRLDAWISVLNDDLQFIRKDERFQARYEVTVIANDRGGRQAKGDQIRRRRWVESYEETNRAGGASAERVSLELAPGTYTIVFRVRDVNSGVESEGEQRVVLPKPESGLWLSSLKFLEGGRERGGHLGDAALIARAYGDSLPVMRSYVEVYGAGTSEQAVKVEYEIVSGNNRVATGFARALATPGFGRGYVVEVPTDSLSIGTYGLRVAARRDDEPEATTCGRFRVLSSEALWWRDFDEMLNLLSYIATKPELERLKAVPEENRRNAWEEFWAGRDPTPNTERNEVRREFFERVSYANQHFGEMMLKGWQTDRGRIYIMEGPPDNIESHPMDLSGKPWEAWYYERRGIVYIFVDRNGFGQYVLVETR